MRVYRALSTETDCTGMADTKKRPRGVQRTKMTEANQTQPPLTIVSHEASYAGMVAVAAPGVMVLQAQCESH